MKKFIVTIETSLNLRHNPESFNYLDNKVNIYDGVKIYTREAFDLTEVKQAIIEVEKEIEKFNKRNSSILQQECVRRKTSLEVFTIETERYVLEEICTIKDSEGCGSWDCTMLYELCPGLLVEKVSKSDSTYTMKDEEEGRSLVVEGTNLLFDLY